MRCVLLSRSPTFRAASFRLSSVSLAVSYDRLYLLVLSSCISCTHVLFSSFTHPLLTHMLASTYWYRRYCLALQEKEAARRREREEQRRRKIQEAKAAAAAAAARGQQRGGGSSSGRGRGRGGGSEGMQVSDDDPLLVLSEAALELMKRWVNALLSCLVLPFHECSCML